ncbi:MAG: exo-alpha-sialidase, partial [Candidatus Marinimicrobia bacterium]|nr:exo-alpha-sialidase [Candidatus Neomarinimicrobiota bacterium]
MSKGKVNRVGMIAVFSLLAVAVLWQAKLYLAHENEKPHRRKIVSTSSRKSPAKAKRARLEYFQRMLRDPATGQIPRGIRQGELEFAARLKGLAKAQGSAGLDTMFTWKEAGPTDVGGRTRALAIDVTNSQVVIVGGVSGGLWKSTDGGATWVLKSDPNQVLSITSIAQDTRTGSTDIWYAVTGEFRGSTFDNVNAGSSYFGAGIYKSTDGGDNWVLIQSAADPSSWDTKFDMVMRVVVSPTTGDVFIATNNYGVYRSTDGGVTFTGVLGNTPNDHSYSDVAVDADGYVYAVINYSPVSTAAPQQAAGVYISDDGGANWDVITPTGYPVRQERSVLALPASNVNALYLMTYTGEFIVEDEEDDVRLYKFDRLAGTSVDLTRSPS